MQKFICTIFLSVLFFSTYGCATKGGYTKIDSPDQRIYIEGASILPPQGDGWYFKKEHDGSIRFGKSGKTKDQSIVGTVVLFKLPDLKSKEDFLNLVSEQRAKNSQGPREVLLNKTVLSDEKGEFCVRGHTITKEFKPNNLPVASNFLLTPIFALVLTVILI